MSIPGTNIEEPVEERIMEPGGEPPPPTEDEEEGDELIQSVKGADGSDVVPVGDVIRFRKQARQLRKDLATERAARAALDAKVNDIMPTVEAIRANPRLVEMAQQGTRPSGTTTIQPENDAEAREWAEDYGLITQTGELDVARARRQLDKLDERAARIAERQNAPLRAQTAQQVSSQNRVQARAVTLQDGTKFATDEATDQAFLMLPAELTADSKVAAIIPLIAAGIDRARGKTPRGPAAREDYGDPLITESGGRRGPAPINSDLQKMLEKTGVTEKELRATEAKYVPGRPMRLE